MTQHLATPNRNLAKPNTALTIPTNIGLRLDYLIVDGSGSMIDKWWPTIDALDTFLRDLRSDPVCKDNYLVTSVFSDGDDMNMIQRNGKLVDQPLLGEDPPLGSTFGGTALYDAIGIGIYNVRQMQPTDVNIVVASDGEEQDSKLYDLEQAKAFIRWAEAQGWQFTIIGCDWNSKKLADLLGLQPSQAIGVAKAHLSEAARSLAAKRNTFARSGAPMHWTEDEQKQFGGYLTSGGSK